MSIYWRLGVSSKKEWRSYVYFKTNNRFIPSMIVDLAVRSGDLLETFAERVDEVIEITREEYLEHMWE